MLKVCLICKAVFGCNSDKLRLTCDYCTNPCQFRRQAISADVASVSHGVCDACRPNRTKFSY
jgi:hypothetical protein